MNDGASPIITLAARSMNSTFFLGLTLACTGALSAQGIRPIAYSMDPRVAASARRLSHQTIYDSAYNRQRDIWIYTPPNYDAKAPTPYPLIVAFDGFDYRDTMPLPFILDTLLATKKAPAYVAVLIDNGGGTERIADLGNAHKMVDFLAHQLVPYVRSHWRVTSDPRRVIITGSSAGGLASAFVAVERPDLFGNVLSQSGAFWRGAEASNEPPYEWLTSHVEANPPHAVRFYLDVGALETRGALGGAAPSILEANRRLKATLERKGYSVVAYTEVPEGQHAPQYWMTGLPRGIVLLSGDRP
jgi:enterochelin esterase-like enzyme